MVLGSSKKTASNLAGEQRSGYPRRSCPTEGLQHLFMRRRRLRIPRRLGLVFKGPRQHIVQFMEGVIAARLRIADRRLNAVIARDESRIDRAHARAARFWRVVFQ